MQVCVYHGTTVAGMRRTDPASGEAALATWHREPGVDRPTLATAVRYTLETLAQRAPGNSVELRVPPFGAVQCVPGPRHTRGTPASVVETDSDTWLALATGGLVWAEATAAGLLRASGARSDLSPWLPVTPPAPPGPASGPALGTVEP